NGPGPDLSPRKEVFVIAAKEPVEVREKLLDRIQDARAETDKVFAIVHEGALYERPIAERHRIVFYIGHLEAFDWNLLHGHVPSLTPFDPSLDRLFAFGIDPVDGGLPSDRPSDWPSLDIVLAYRQRIRQLLDERLNETSFSDWASDET